MISWMLEEGSETVAWPAGNLVVETLWCHPLAASPSSSSCWRWIPCHKQLDAGGDQALGLPPSHVEQRAVSHRELWLAGGSEMWPQEVAWGGQSGDGPSAAGWATSGGRKAPGHELCLPRLVPRSTLQLLLWCSSQGGVESSSGALGGSPVDGFTALPVSVSLGQSRLCVGMDSTVGTQGVVWFAASCLRDEG